MRVLAAVLAFILFVASILIVSVPKLRSEEGPVGIVAVVWAFLVSLWAILADRVVATGKKEEEVRLTGRAETRRTLREWSMLFSATAILAVYIVISILLTSNLILRARDASLEYPGKRYSVDGGKYDIHLACFGSTIPNTPTLLLESPASKPNEYSLAPWALDNLLNSTVDRVCYWDRPGYAFSDTAPSPHSAGLSATALSQVLAQAEENGPWIIMAGGYGAIVARVFASMHEHDTAGLLLVDPFPESLLAERAGGFARGARVWAWSVLSPLGIGRFYGAIFKGRTREDRVYGRSVGSSGKFLRARLQQTLVADSLTYNDAVAAQTILSRSTIPLAVVSGGEKCKRDTRWCDGQKEASGNTGNLLGWEVVKDIGYGNEVWEEDKGGKVLKEWIKKLVKGL
jgi:pimeloyl-ACP methyl ester carboxylesterase